MNRIGSSMSRSLYLALGVLGAGFLLPGCAKEAPPRYVLSSQVTALPAPHQQQIQETLVKYYGTAPKPRWLVPQAPSAESDTAEGASAEGPAAEGGKLVDRVDPAELLHGAAVYRRNCAACHGVTGDGNGPAASYLTPKPRDYRRGIFKFTSTPYGAKPRRQDLIRTIRRGAKGTSMPSFRWMANADLHAVVDYITMLSYRGELEHQMALEAADYDESEKIDQESIDEYLTRIAGQWDEAEAQIVLPMTPMPRYSDETIALGRQAFLTRGCSKCHGADGRGYTQDNVGQDVWGNTVKAADLTSGMLHGGRRPVDIYRRISSGINGTPMPAFRDSLAQEPDTIWHLAHYVLSVVEGRQVPGAADTPAVIPTEAAPAEEKPAEEKPAEEKPAEEKPAEEKPAEEKPAGEAGSGESSNSQAGGS